MMNSQTCSHRLWTPYCPLPRKFLLVLLLLSGSVWMGYQAKAQCGAASDVFPSMDSLPCIVVGESTDFYIPYKCLESIYASHIDSGGNERLSDRSVSLKIESISNIPCGLSVDIASVQNPISMGQTGCLRVHGTATDTAGYYKLNVMVSFNITDASLSSYTHTNVSLDNYLPLRRLLVIRVVYPGTPCTPLIEMDQVYQQSHCN